MGCIVLIVVGDARAYSGPSSRYFGADCIEVRATSCTVLPRARFSALKLKSQYETIRIIYLVKLLKILVDKALNTAESSYIYFAVVEFT